jgi:peptidoglycan/LPS O-acetylase OafA/YrhL
VTDLALTPRAPRLRALTGIRFIAAIFVFSAHVPAPAGAPRVVAGLSLAGHDGLTLFFTLSGLILAWNYDELLSSGLTGRGLRTYVVARFARIYPLYLLALALAIVPTISSGGQIAALLKSREFWLHVFALQTWSGNQSVAFGFNGPGWSIGVEIFLYALFPFLILLIARARHSWRLLLAMGILALVVLFVVTFGFQLSGLAALPDTDPMSAHRWLYRTPLTRIPDFVVGIVICYLIKSTSSLQLQNWGRVLQILGSLLIIGEMLTPAIAYSVWSFDLIEIVPFALVFLGLVWSPETLFARVLASRAGVFLGEASFAFYLLHQTIINLVGRSGGGYGAWLSSALIAFVVSLFAAAGAHILFERPMRSWVRRRLDPHPPIAPMPLGEQQIPLPAA